jgi:hypothetical protein
MDGRPRVVRRRRGRVGDAPRAPRRATVPHRRRDPDGRARGRGDGGSHRPGRLGPTSRPETRALVGDRPGAPLRGADRPAAPGRGTGLPNGTADRGAGGIEDPPLKVPQRRGRARPPRAAPRGGAPGPSWVLSLRGCPGLGDRAQSGAGQRPTTPARSARAYPSDGPRCGSTDATLRVLRSPERPHRIEVRDVRSPVLGGSPLPRGPVRHPSRGRWQRAPSGGRGGRARRLPELRAEGELRYFARGRFR